MTIVGGCGAGAIRGAADRQRHTYQVSARSAPQPRHIFDVTVAPGHAQPEGLGGQIVQVAYLTRTVVLRKRRLAFHTNESLAFVSFVACTGYLSFNCSR